MPLSCCFAPAPTPTARLPTRFCRNCCRTLLQVAEGSDADVIIFDPAVRHTISAKAHHSAMDTNIYEGYEVTGKVRG